VDKNPFVFISYSHRDEAFVERLNNSLNSVGIATWRDREQLKVGMNWPEEIRKGVANAACFLFVLSPPAVSSPHVGVERDYAKQYDKRVLTILLHPCEIPNDYRSIQYADFQEDANFRFAFVQLGEAICQSLPDGDQICAALSQKPEYIVTEHLRQIKQIEETIQDWMLNLRQRIPEKSPWNAERLNETAADRLAEYASDAALNNPQRREDAARLIADLGAANALQRLVVDISNHFALDALAVIYEKRQDWPPDLIAGIRRRVFRRTAVRQLTQAEPPLLPRFLAASAGPALAIAFTVYVETGFLERFPLAALGGALSNGVAYGLMVGAAILWTHELAPRLKILKGFRFALGLLGGWALAIFAFFLLNKLFYGRTPESWDTIIQYSFLLIVGFAAASLFEALDIAVNRVRSGSLFLGMIAALIGVYMALGLPCPNITDPFLGPVLLRFSSDCYSKSFTAAALIALIPFIPDLIDFLRERRVGQNFLSWIQRGKT